MRPTSVLRAAALALAAAIALVACAPVEQPGAGPATETPATTGPAPATPPGATPTAEPATPDTPAEDWPRCTNTGDGYTIAYPPGWSTNEEAVGDLPPCSLFDPRAEDLRFAERDVPLDVAVTVVVEPVPRHDVAAPGGVTEEIARREEVVAGRDALRLEREATGEGELPAGLRLTLWAVDLDGLTLVARTSSAGQEPYADKQAVLDRMVATLTVERAPPSCSAAGLDADLDVPDGLPEAVVRTRFALAQAAVACDYERLASLAGEGFTYSFGDTGDPAGFWRRAEASGDEPLRLLVELLRRPYGTVLVEGRTQYVWPSAFVHDDWTDVPEGEREALRPLYDDADFELFERFGGYIGHRAGIAEDGDWLFFVAGD